MVQAWTPGWDPGRRARPVVGPSHARDHCPVAETCPAPLGEPLVEVAGRRYAGWAGGGRSPPGVESRKPAGGEATSDRESREPLEGGAVCATGRYAQRA